MITEAISPLRQRMIEDMSSRKLGTHTQRSHIYSCKRFAAFLKRSPDTATAEDIRLFQLHLAETGMSICNRNRIMTGVRFLFRVTLRRLDLAAETYHLREPQKIAQVMSPDETRRHAQRVNGGMPEVRRRAVAPSLNLLMASLLLLGGGDGSSSDFYLEYLCRSSFRLFREPLRHTAAPPLSRSTPRLVRA
jgi:site-specific recombinase XerD